jgi:hypothetical protein
LVELKAISNAMVSIGFERKLILGQSIEFVDYLLMLQ